MIFKSINRGEEKMFLFGNGTVITFDKNSRVISNGGVVIGKRMLLLSGRRKN